METVPPFFGLAEKAGFHVKFFGPSSASWTGFLSIVIKILIGLLDNGVWLFFVHLNLNTAGIFMSLENS